MDNMNIKAIVSLLGINEHTLRAWERRYKAISPDRNEGGRRTYSNKDIERLKMLVSLVNDGHSIGIVAKKSDDELRSLLGKRQKNHLPSTKNIENYESYLQQIIAPLEHFDLEKLNQAMIKARFELSPKILVMKLILPLLGRVGQLVCEGKLSVAQEHVLSALLRDHLGQIYHSLAPYNFSAFVSKKNYALSTREGDIHEFGILISATLCALHRKKTHYLGPNIPAKDLVDACKQFHIHHLILGASIIPPEKETMCTQEYLKYLDKHLPENTTIWIGGSDSYDAGKIKTTRKILPIKSIEELDQLLDKEI